MNLKDEKLKKYTNFWAFDRLDSRNRSETKILLLFAKMTVLVTFLLKKLFFQRAYFSLRRPLIKIT